MKDFCEKVKMEKPYVNVLMSTYNGERYLDKQIQSLLNQKDINLIVSVRDDGSTDKTIKILEKYEKNHENFTYFVSKNVGACNSFLQLIYNCSLEYDYYAFCDQDDIWLDCKMSRAIDKLEKFENPALYYSSQIFCENGRKYLKKRRNEFEPTFFECLLKSDFPGCTMVLNRAAMLCLRELKCPKHAIMHDWFIYQVARGIGFQIVYDNNSYILYRIHGNNVSVLSKNIMKRYSRIKRIVKNQRYSRSNANIELMQICKDKFDDKNLLILDIISNYNKSFGYLLNITKRIMNSSFTFKYRIIFIVSFWMHFY